MFKKTKYILKNNTIKWQKNQHKLKFISRKRLKEREKKVKRHLLTKKVKIIKNPTGVRGVEKR
jgi:hypothetical protein